MRDLNGYYVKKIGQNRGAPRVWLEGTATERAGFFAGQRYDIVVEGKTIVLQANKDGSRTVSSKRIGERVNPVIDLNSKELLAVFDGMAAVRVAVREGEIYIVPLASELKKQERMQRLRHKLENGEPLTLGSLSHGGGILSNAIHKGLEEAGIESRLAFANDIRPELLEHAAEHNEAWDDNTIVYAAPMQELAFDERGLASIPKTEGMEIGIPCEASSLSGLAKVGHKVPEAHPETGHLVASTIVIINKVNPAFITFECVPNYAHTGSAAILRTQLKELGYVTSERILNGKEWGELENRNRWCMLAVSEGLHMDFDSLMPPKTAPRKLGDVLEHVPDGDPRWSKFEGLKAKAERDKEAGKNFKMQPVTADSDYVGTIGKGYMKRRSTEPFVVNENDTEYMRLLTVQEHAAVKGIPAHLVDGLSATIAHEVLGQSIVYSPFKDIGEHIGNSLNRLVERPESQLSERTLPQQKPHCDSPDYSPEFVDVAKEVVASFRAADESKGRYSGQIVAIENDKFIQDVGRNEGIVHHIKSFNRVPKLGESVKITYEKGHGQVAEKQKPQLTLEI